MTRKLRFNSSTIHGGQEEEKKNQEPKQEEGGRIFRYMYIV